MLRHVGILTGSQLILNLGFSQIVPVMPMFAAEMGGHLGATGVGLVLSAPSAATLLLNVPLGRLADTVGRKPLMWAGTAITASGIALTAFCNSLWTLLPCRLLVGAGSASSMTGSSAFLADLSDSAPQHRAKLMGINQMIIGSVWVIGPALGGWLAETYGLRNSFLIAGAGAMLCSIGYTQLPETLKRVPHLEKKMEEREKEEKMEKTKSGATTKTGGGGGGRIMSHVKDWWCDVQPIIRSRNQQALIAQACVFPLRFSCFTTVVALHAHETFGAGPSKLLLLFLVFFLVLSCLFLSFLSHLASQYS